MINYLKFGFPLSMKCNGLYNLEVVNHSSAEAYPEAVQRYLDKEVELGAMLGPYNEITYHLFHCSPLLTRPKDNNERRVILDLSFPRGNSLNDQVSKNLFDGTEFQLKLPLVDHIVNDINNTENRIYCSR